MNKQFIISEIKRTAEENEDKPLGESRFFQVTGISRKDWYGKYWARWGDAQEDAGYSRNKKQEAYSEEYILQKLISLIRENGAYPTISELRLKSNTVSNFPAHNTFRRLGRKSELIKKVIEYCKEREDLNDVLEICLPLNTFKSNEREEDVFNGKPIENGGQVYLLKHDKVYKIGKSTDVTRRYKEIQTQMPHKMEEVHVIATDDPSGIELYWHNRFKDKRLEGEWFELSANDIRAFKKRRFM